MKTLLSIALALMLTSPAGAALAQEVGSSREFSIVIANQTKDSGIARVVVERHNLAEEFFETDPVSGNFTYKVKLTEHDWFHPVDVKVVWTIPAATGSNQNEFYHRFSLLIPFDFPQDSYQVPVFYETNVTRYRMDDLDLLTNEHDQFEVFFSTYRIYDHYRSTSPNSVYGNFLKRVSNKLFEAAKTLALQEPYIFRMNEDARDWAEISYQGNQQLSSRYRDRGLDALSVYWYSLSKVDRMTRSPDDRASTCSRAKYLMEAFERDYATPQGKVSFQFRNSNNTEALTQMRTLLDSRCSS